MSDPSAIQPFAVDPGGVFESDLHRRVCGHLPHDDGDEATPDTITVWALADRLFEDPDSLRKIGKFPNLQLIAWDNDGLSAVLEALEAEGYATSAQIEGDVAWSASEDGIAALTGPALTHSVDGKMVEPPPMEGERLKQAEAANKAEAEAAAAGEREAAEARVKRAEEEVAAAKSDLKGLK